MAEHIWPDNWRTDLSDAEKRSLEAELSRELPKGHILYGQHASAIAMGYDPDDKAFQLADGRFALVHFTWHKPSVSDVPYTLIFDDLVSLFRCDESNDP